jgi:hypothetical protein
MCAGPRAGTPACIRYRPGKVGRCASSFAKRPHHRTSSSRNVAHLFPQPDISAWWPGRAWLRNSAFSDGHDTRAIQAYLGHRSIMYPNAASSFGLASHMGDVVEESDGDLMGNGVNCRAPGRDRQNRRHLSLGGCLKNIAEPVRVYSLEVGRPAQVKQPSASIPPRLSTSSSPSPISAAILSRSISWTASPIV